MPANEKYPPPSNRTGYTGIDLTEAEVLTTKWSGNIALRMPDDVIGIDIDAYHGGIVTLTDMEQRLGVLPPTWTSHSNRDDGSGIRFFRVQVGRAWTASLPGIEIVQRTHRYAMVWPSRHPEGRNYSWQGPDEFDHDLFGDTIPAVDDLAYLPQTWHDELSMPAASRTHSRAADPVEADGFMQTYTFNDAPQCLQTITASFSNRWHDGHSRHDSMQHCLTWAMEEARAGLFPAPVAVERLHDLWDEALAADPRRAASYEFAAMVRHAVGKANDKTQDWLDAKHDEHAGIPMNSGSSRTDADTQVTGDPSPSAADSPWIDWTAFINRDPSHRPWLIDGLWPWGRGIALWASAKAGKSELVLWCVGNLALGIHPWTGQPVEPVDVAYFDYEMTEDDLDDRLADFDFDPQRLDHLHYALLPPLFALDTDAGGEQLLTLAQSVEAQVVVIDTLMRSVGGEENTSDTFKNFARFTGSRLKRAGIAYLRTDHAGHDTSKNYARGSSAKRDDVDVAWRLTRSQRGVRLDCTGSSRLGWVPQQLDLDRLIDPQGIVSYRPPVAIHLSPPGVTAKVAEIDALTPPLPANAGRPAVTAALRNAGVTPGKTLVLNAAIRVRREREQSKKLTGNSSGGNSLGTDEPDDLFD